MADDKPIYAEGGFIPAGAMQIRFDHPLISYQSYKALSPEMRSKLFREGPPEIVFSAADVREMGPGLLESLQGELEEEQDEDYSRTADDSCIEQDSDL